MAHLAFVSYATDRVLCGHYHNHHNHRHQPQQTCTRRETDGNTNNTSGAQLGGSTKKSPACPEAAAAKDVLLGDGDGFVESTANWGEGRCLTYCEVTGAPKLMFPLGFSAANSKGTSTSTKGVANPRACYGGSSGTTTDAAVGVEEDDHLGSLVGVEAVDGGGGNTTISTTVVVVEKDEAALQAYRALNAFVGGLATADAVEAAGDKKSSRCGGGGIAPYTINV